MDLVVDNDGKFRLVAGEEVESSVNTRCKGDTIVIDDLAGRECLLLLWARAENRWTGAGGKLSSFLF